MEAAVRLLTRDGVLAGLNMQEVADEAGVNRGLIHHYFGSRQALLRAAIARQLAEDSPRFQRTRTLSLAEKIRRHFRGLARDSTFARLVMLSAIDDDEELEPIPFVDDRLDDLRRDREESHCPTDDMDLIARIVMWDATVYGYFVLRDSACRQLGVSTDELDRRILTLARTNLRSSEEP